MAEPTPIPDPPIHPHITAALRFNDPFITSALSLDTPPPSVKPKRTSSRQAQRRDSGLLWLHDNHTALDTAFQQDNQPQIEGLKGALLDILNPQWPEWAYRLIYWVILPLSGLILYPVQGRFAHPIAAAIFAYLPTLLLRTYYTFRSRILASIGYQPERPTPVVRSCLDSFARTYAVGNPAFRVAPLAEAWSGLTGRERSEPAWYRTLNLVLVIIASTMIDRVILPAILAFLFRSTFGRCGLSLRFHIGPIPIEFNPQVFCSGLVQTGLGRLQRLADSLAYRWRDYHPILRGFADQLLETYEMPNPARNADLASDALVAAAALGNAT